MKMPWRPPYRSTLLAWAALALSTMGGCKGDEPRAAKPDTAQQTPSSHARLAPSGDAQAAPKSSSPATPSSHSPAAELAALDKRVAVPLQPMMAWHQKQNMMDHLVAIQQITGGLAKEDWEAVLAATKKIGSSPQMEQMCQHMGVGAQGFTEAALDFHRRADAIGEAARQKDTSAVLRATSATLQACTSCHAVFKQEVVDSATWQARTGQAHAPPAHTPHSHAPHSHAPHSHAPHSHTPHSHTPHSGSPHDHKPHGGAH